MSRARDVSSINTDTAQVITSLSTSDVPLTIIGSSGQTANLLNIKNSAGNIMSSIGIDGRLYATDSVVQIKRYEWSSEYSMSGTWGTATNSSYSFTPLRSNSKILIIAELATEPYYAGGGYAGMGIRILRDGSPIATPGQTHEVYVSTSDLYVRTVKSHYINANSTNSTTFATQIASYASSTAVRINQGGNWTSSYTIYEVAQ